MLPVWNSTAALVRRIVRQKETVVDPRGLVEKLLEEGLQEHYRQDKNNENRVQTLIKGY